MAWLRLALALVVLLTRVAGIYMLLRLRLWAWRLSQRRVFSKKVSQLPPGLREELVERYSEELSRVKVPGLLSLAGLGGGEWFKFGRRRS